MAIAGDDQQVYYRLMQAYCQWALAGGAGVGFAEIESRSTTEKLRMDALGVIAYAPIGFEPVPPGQSADDRTPKLLRAECALAVLTSRLTQVLEELS